MLPQPPRSPQEGVKMLMMSPPNTSENAYLHLSAMYGFTPLPPPLPFTPKTAALAAKPPPLLEGGTILVACCIKAALCIKTTRSFWGDPISNDPSEDNKPIPGWTDGSNTWRASVYGFAPPRDFTRPDSDDAAIRAYGSYVASPHRSQGVHLTLDEYPLTTTVNNDNLPSSVHLVAAQTDATTQKLYNQYSATFAQHSHSRHLLSHTGPLCSCSTCEFSLLKLGAEGRLLVPDVKMHRYHHKAASVSGCLHQQHCDNHSNKFNTAPKTTHSFPAVKVANPLHECASFNLYMLPLLFLQMPFLTISLTYPVSLVEPLATLHYGCNPMTHVWACDPTSHVPNSPFP